MIPGQLVEAELAQFFGHLAAKDKDGLVVRIRIEEVVELLPRGNVAWIQLQ